MLLLSSLLVPGASMSGTSSMAAMVAEANQEDLAGSEIKAVQRDKYSVVCMIITPSGCLGGNAISQSLARPRCLCALCNG